MCMSGCVSLEGHYPEVDEGDELAEMLVLGPLTRFAEDLPLMLSVMAGEEAGKLRLHQEVPYKSCIFTTFSHLVGPLLSYYNNYHCTLYKS